MYRQQLRSGYEHQIADDLEERCITFNYESETFTFKTTVRNGICGKCGGRPVYQRRKYTPDFEIIREAPLGSLFVEAKGILDSKTRSKMRAVLKDNPHLDLRILLQGKATWKQGKANAAWCEKYNFKYAFGHVIPEDWLR